MHEEKKRRKAFRCAIAPEHSQAVLRVGSRKHAINVLDTSRDGFTLRCPARLAKHFKAGGDAKLIFRGEVWAVRRISLYNESSDFVHIGCERIQDVTRVKAPKSSFLAAMTPRFATSSDPTFLMFLVVALIIAVVSLPGIGDRLGTAKKINRGIKSVANEVDDIF